MTQPQHIFIASDHAGFELKQHLMQKFKKLHWVDLGPSNSDSVDYPDFADQVVQKLKSENKNALGVLICGSGQGMAIRANRFSFIRAALCTSAIAAKFARLHNDANVLCLGSRFVDPHLAEEILQSFLSETFEGGRHERRVRKLSEGC